MVVANTLLVALLGAAPAMARHSHGHRHLHKEEPVKRSTQCQFPTDAGLVAVTPDAENAGWAMSPDQPCTPGSYCPYACPPGQVSLQWNPLAIAYTYPLSMDGGLYCDEDGNISKPFPNEDYCGEATGPVVAQNDCDDDVAICQTVLPGNEAMLIPNNVQTTTQLAVPSTNYWCETAAHYYINSPGYSTEEACVWGDVSKPLGNWAPYVAGANTDATGMTYVKIGWNPIWLEPATPFRDTVPEFGVEITCDDGAGCVGLPCAIDPDTNGVNEMTGDDISTGAGGATFCVVTVPKGQQATIRTYSGSSSGSSEVEAKVKVAATSSAAPSSTSTSSTSTSSSTSSSSSSSTSSSSSMSSSSAVPTSSAVSTSSSAAPSSTFVASTSSALPKVKGTAYSSLSYPTGTNAPHVFLAQGTGSAAAAAATASSIIAAEASATTSSNTATGGAGVTGVSTISLFAAVLAAAVFLN